MTTTEPSNDKELVRESVNPALNKKSMRTIIVLGALIGGVVGGVVGGGAGGRVVRALMGQTEARIDRSIAQAADAINKNLPTMVDQNTRLDATAALPGKKLMYRYTIIDLDPLPSSDELQQAMRPKLINNYKTSEDMESLRKNDVTLVYSYADEAGNQISRFEIGTGDF